MNPHWKHTNPLIIHNELPDPDGRKVCCIACRYLILSGPFYSCGHRDCYLHKVCAEVPLELKHPLHSDHTLTLVSGDTGYSTCMACDTWPVGERMYECRPCGFSLDLECASMALRIQHECHPHPLIPLLEPALFHCYACGNKHTGMKKKTFLTRM
ncbi:protein VACUOLELESS GAMETOPHYTES-like isoform X3 [Actinidia eriantha]|uniref:protein VACUOLELESS GAMETOPHYTES-like isoform X3 n=1 Tax=Actinidia eriantha TaxID=165200 RepID=UPI00258A35A3|nr:protein VACUOLELESS GAMETOPHYTES-like isoform X3 [Actinidia eriantha]